MKTYLLITPHSECPDALAATEATLAAMPGGGRFARTANGSFERVDGKLVLECSLPRFVVWAAVRQGYVQAAEIEGDAR